MRKLLLTGLVALTFVGAQAQAGCGNCGGHGKSRGECHGNKKQCKGGECRADTGKARAMAAQKGEKDKLATISTAALKVLLDTSDDVVVLDARSDKYDDGRRLPGAVQLTADSSKEQLTDVVPDKDALIVAYCSNLKCPASTHLAHHLLKHGYSNVIKYPEGLEAWIAAGHGVESAE